MNNKLPINRVETELNQWRSKEERFCKLFSFNLSTNRALLKEKLDYYNSISAKYRGTNNLDERFALKMLRQERNNIEKQLYPNLLLRLLRRLLIAPVREQIVIRNNIRTTNENSRSLQQQLQRAGFNNFSTRLEDQIKQGHQQFSLSASSYVNDNERLEHKLSFAKDQSGLYQFEGYLTTLHNEVKRDEQQQQYFSMRNGHEINVTEAYNLLSGRAVQKGDTWIQLDFNDKDPHGNYRIKQHFHDHNYNLNNILQQLPMKELQNTEEAQKIHNELRKGNLVSVSFLKDGHEQRYYIEANPQFKSINIYDEHSRKITINDALGNKTLQAVKETNKMSEQQKEGQAKKRGVRING